MICVSVAACLATQVVAQSNNPSAASSWNSSYGFPSPTERNVRLNFIVEQEKLRNNYYQPAQTIINTTNNTTNNTDHSVSNSINAAEGAVVDVENRTAENSGTSSSVVGSINESTTNISTEGSGTSSINVANASENQGCLDGAITVSANRPSGGFDISSGGGGSAGSNSVSVSRGNC
jgi:hypothetical protein